ncbi:MAG TPA: hypothetical protein VLI05_06045 [Candidatus Saccharimonadia bacterium]|nr:hypothetical protein [Candidatus Saccharimonadia bacterium]
MFTARSIWKRPPRRSLRAIAFALCVSLAISQPVLAFNEAYVWTDSSRTTITGTGGNFGSGTATFTKGTESGGTIPFTGNASYSCVGKDFQTQLTVTVKSDDYNNPQASNLTGGTVTGGDSSCDFTAAVIKLAGTDAGTGAPTQDPVDKCDQGGLSWLFCPVIDNITRAITGLVKGALVPLLRVNRITPQTTPGLYQTWTHIRDLADVLFILVFFIIIGSTLLNQDIGLDAYTIKKIWPRLIIAAVAVQFSFLGCAIIVDLGNVLAAGIQTFFNDVLAPSSGPASVSNFVENIGVITAGLGIVGGTVFGALGLWAAALPILVSLLATVLVVFLVLGLRFLVMAVIIAGSPLIVLHMILWRSNDGLKLFLRLVLMYPMTVGILSLVAIINQLLAFNDGAAGGGLTDSTAASVAAALMKPIVALAAFLLIIFTFRLAGRTIQTVHRLMHRTTQGALKKTSFWQEGVKARQSRQASLMMSLTNSKTITGLTHSSNAGKRLAGAGLVGISGLMLGNAPKSGRAVGRSYNAAYKAHEKSLGDLDTISPDLIAAAFRASYGDKAALKQVHEKAPALMEYTKTLAGRQALATKANAANSFGDKEIRAMHASRPQDGNTVMASLGSKNWKERRYLFYGDFDDPKFKVNEEAYGGYLRTLSADELKKVIHVTSLETATGLKAKRADGTTSWDGADERARSMARSWRDHLSTTALSEFMTPGDRNYGQTDKRAQLLKMMSVQKDVFKDTAQGRQMLQIVADKMTERRNADIFADFYKEVLNDDPSRYDLANDLHFQQMRDRIRNALKP